MSASTNIRRLERDDAQELIALRRQALENHPLAFDNSLADDHLSPDYIRQSLANEGEQAIFGYFERAVLTGMVGLYRSLPTKQRHHANIWGMYVAAHARKKGAGRALLHAAIAHARIWPGIEQVHLSVTETATAARRLYTSAGFRCWGHRPRALVWEGSYVDDFHLVLELDEPAPSEAGEGRASPAAS